MKSAEIQTRDPDQSLVFVETQEDKTESLEEEIHLLGYKVQDFRNSRNPISSVLVESFTQFTLTFRIQLNSLLIYFRHLTIHPKFH